MPQNPRPSLPRRPSPCPSPRLHPQSLGAPSPANGKRGPAKGGTEYADTAYPSKGNETSQVITGAGASSSRCRRSLSRNLTRSGMPRRTALQKPPPARPAQYLRRTRSRAGTLMPAPGRYIPTRYPHPRFASARPSRGLCGGRCPITFHHVLRFRPRNQHVGCHLKVQSPKFLVAPYWLACLWRVLRSVWG